MAGTVGPLQFRGIGGEYAITVQAEEEFTAADTWLVAAVTTMGLVADRCYNGWVPEGITIPAGTIFVTYRWLRNLQPDDHTFGVGGREATISYLCYEVLAWVQGKTYTPAAPVAAALRLALDVGATATTGGTILGAGRYGPARGSYEKET